MGLSLSRVPLQARLCPSLSCPPPLPLSHERPGLVIPPPPLPLFGLQFGRGTTLGRMTIRDAHGPSACGFTLVLTTTTIPFGACVSKNDPACVEVEGCIASPGLGSHGFSPPSLVRSHLCTERMCHLRSSMQRKHIQLWRGEYSQ